MRLLPHFTTIFLNLYYTSLVCSYCSCVDCDCLQTVTYLSRVSLILLSFFQYLYVHGVVHIFSLQYIQCASCYSDFRELFTYTPQYGIVMWSSILMILYGYRLAQLFMLLSVDSRAAERTYNVISISWVSLYISVRQMMMSWRRQMFNRELFRNGQQLLKGVQVRDLQ